MTFLLKHIAKDLPQRIPRMPSASPEPKNKSDIFFHNVFLGYHSRPVPGK
jgi:hypothetical protein